LTIFETLPYGNWYQRMGDPTITGWTITIAYFLVTLLCWRAGLKEKTINVNIQKPERHVLWFGLSILLLVLGINKQLDLQTLLISLGRDIAQANGLYESRREIQLIFVILFALFCFSSIVALSWWLRDCWRRYWIALLGLALLVSFVVIRAASFQHVDYLISKWSIIGPFWMKYMVELGGILIVGLGAVQSLYRTYKVERVLQLNESTKNIDYGQVYHH